jgi:hypothetical protein
MTSKRELIARDGEQHCVRRDAETGQFKEWDKVSGTFPAIRGGITQSGRSADRRLGRWLRRATAR